MAEAPAGKHSAAPIAPKGKQKASRTGLKVLLAVLIVGVLAGAGYYTWGTMQLQKAASNVTDPIVPDQSASTSEQTKVSNPVDFDSLTAQNADTIGWISVPNTNVNYPVMKSSTDDSYYLQHNFNGEYDIAGAIYMELQNSSSFLDSVTVLYGHCISGDSMFTTLHYFEDTTFFNNHPTFYIYTPGHILTYTIVSSYQADDSHILNTHKFSDQQVLLNYFASVQHPDALVQNSRSTADTTLTATSKIVQLSTCMTNDIYDNRRYIVTGVLTNDQLTN